MKITVPREKEMIDVVPIVFSEVSEVEKIEKAKKKAADKEES